MENLNIENTGSDEVAINTLGNFVNRVEDLGNGSKNNTLGEFLDDKECASQTFNSLPDYVNVLKIDIKDTVVYFKKQGCLPNETLNVWEMDNINQYLDDLKKTTQF
jgi:hypothetical protein